MQPSAFRRNVRVALRDQSARTVADIAVEAAMISKRVPFGLIARCVAGLWPGERR